MREKIHGPTEGTRRARRWSIKIRRTGEQKKKREEGADTGTNRIHKEGSRAKEQIERQRPRITLRAVIVQGAVTVRKQGRGEKQ